ncbi:hypothetical protein [Streptomyces sp. CT34]|uniref:hypothetical protein n=1 Tax=Streptomyces sp. CT34 TaxID=1553907 RepID=UPI0018E30931|nr:hypothetical protein [Streptomyces sp. CT34]
MARRPSRGAVAALGGLLLALTSAVLPAAAAPPAAPAAEDTGMTHDAPDAGALSRQVQRSGQLSPPGYQLSGKPVRGTADRQSAPVIAPGQYQDSIGPNEERYYATDLDAASAADFSATAVPQAGAAADAPDALHTKVVYGTDSSCASTTAMSGQRDGAAPLTSAVSRIPSQHGTNSCDKAGRYWLVVQRTAAKAASAARWPLELTFHVEPPLPKGVTPAPSQPDYGAGGKDATLPTTAPKGVSGGTGFNDASLLHQGVWRDRILPAQTLWYKVPVGWGQQLRYDVEFANEPKAKGSVTRTSFGSTQVYTPYRAPVGNGTGQFIPQVPYNGRVASLKMGTVPVSWANRYETHPDVIPVHAKGDFYIAVTLGARAAQISESPQIGVVLRVAVLGKEKAGPEAAATPLNSGVTGGGSGSAAGTGRWPAIRVAGVSVGVVGVLLLVGLGTSYVWARRKPRPTGAAGDPRKSGSW